MEKELILGKIAGSQFYVQIWQSDIGSEETL
jgi:hypothetical protein